MSATSYIKRFVALSKPHEIFTSRDLLNYGSRAAVDQVVCRMVKAGCIVRLARGVFTKAIVKAKKFTPFEIAKVKAESFGRRIAIHARDIAHKLKILQTGNSEITFAIDGCSSSFIFEDVRIYFKKTSLKKMKLADFKEGEAIRALTFLGKQPFTDDIKKSFREWLFLWPHKMDLMKFNAFMPSWLVDNFCWFKEKTYIYTGKIEHRPTAQWQQIDNDEIIPRRQIGSEGIGDWRQIINYEEVDWKQIMCDEIMDWRQDNQKEDMI